MKIAMSWRRSGCGVYRRGDAGTDEGEGQVNEYSESRVSKIFSDEYVL